MLKRYTPPHRVSHTSRIPSYRHAGGLFQPRRNAATRADNWKSLKLDNDTIYYPKNIVPYRGVTPDFDHRLDPVFVLHSVCSDPRAAIDDIIISRHKNGIDKGEKTDIVSMTAAARTGVFGKFLHPFREAGIQFSLLTHFYDDLRPRIGVTTSCETEKGRHLLESFVNAAHELSPFTLQTREAIKDLLTPAFETTPRLQSFPEDKQFEPPYFINSMSTLEFKPYFGTYLEDDQQIPSVLPEIHKAILAGDVKTFTARLRANPDEVALKDPWGIRAHELAAYIGTQEMYDDCLRIRSELTPNSIGELNRLHHEHVVPRIISTNDGTPEYDEKNEERIRVNREEYLKVIHQPVPVRSALHHACIKGDLAQVQTIIAQQPQRINEQDPRGYTPLLLAAANGHAHLLTWLLEQNASIADMTFNGPFYNNGRTTRLIGKLINAEIGEEHITTLRLIDNAATPEVMLALLRHRIDPHVFNDRLKMAILRNHPHDIRMAEFLTFYLQEYPKTNGLSMFDLAVRESGKHGLDMVAAMLRAMDRKDIPVPDGPYDTRLTEVMRELGAPDAAFKRNSPFNMNISAAIAEMFAKHNQKLLAREKKKSEKAKFQTEQISGNQVMTQFTTSQFNVTSILKPFNDLNVSERNAIRNLFFTNFSLVHEDTDENRNKYINEELTQRDNIQAFANLFYAGDRLIAFMTFEVIHSSQGFIMFHARLAANDANYASHGLVTIAFRSMIAVKKACPDKKIFTYAEAIHPGLALFAALPDGVDFFPKFAKPLSFMREVVDLSGEELVGNVIHTKLKINNREVAGNHFTLRFHAAMTGGSVEKAMPLCYEITDTVETSYYKMAAPHDIDEAKMQLLSDYLHDRMTKINEAAIRARL